MPEEDPLWLEFSDSGAFYRLYRDKGYRSIIVLNLRKIVDFIDSHPNMKVDDMIFYSGAMMTHAREHADQPGRVEQDLTIIDCSNVGLTEIPVSWLGPITASNNRNYRSNLYKTYTVNVHWLLKTITKILFPMLDEST